MMRQPNFTDVWRHGLRGRMGTSSADRKTDNRGVALVMTLLLLFLMSALGLVAVLSSSSDLMINGYYANYRASFYAADSGLNVARGAMQSQFSAAIPTAWNGTQWTSCTAGTNLGPLSATSASTVQSYITSTYGSNSSLNSGGAANSWGESFKITSASVSLASGYPTVTSCPSNVPTGFSYLFNYTLTSVGSATGTEQATVTENGSLIINISSSAGVTPGTVSFSAFGAFINSFPACLGPLVYGTHTGPMYAQGEWNFGSGGSYTFSDPVNQTDGTFSYWPGSNCVQSSSPSYTSGSGHGSTTIAPTFEQGYNLNQAAVPLPPNDFSQRWAVLDGKGCGEGSNVCGNLSSPAPPAPTNSYMNGVLKNVSGTAYPTGGATSGVYLPYTSSSGVNTITGGGIYVEGNANSVVLTAQTGPSPNNNPQQVFTITQGSTTTTITIDPIASTTKVVSGSTTLNLTGVPQNLVGQPYAATMLYVDGNISSLSGPSSGAAVQNNAMITVTANGNIQQTGNLLYATEPVTTTQNQVISGSNPACCNGDPVDTLIPSVQNMNQVLGIFTANGQFQLNPSKDGANLETDASIAMISSNPCSTCGKIATPGNAVGTWTNIGGRMENAANGVNISDTDVYFDRRFTARANFSPPWFPSTTISMTDISNLANTVTIITPQRVQWVSTTGGQ